MSALNWNPKQLSVEKWDWDFFLRVRKDVLAQWPTGKELEGQSVLSDCADRQSKQPWNKFAALRNQRAEAEGRVQVQPVVGHATTEDTVEHMKFSDDLNPDRWYIITDSYTRKGQFGAAKAELERSRREGVSSLNGYAIVEQGVEGTQRINAATNAAVGSDNNDEDPRLAWEFGLAGGFTFGSIKSIEQVIQHSKKYPIEQAIFNQQYLDRLCAYYTEKGAPILRRSSANLVGWDSLGLKIAISVLQCLISAAQGLKHIDLSHGIGMAMMQDIASIHSSRKLAREYLDSQGFNDVRVYPWMYFFIGDWPGNQWANAGQVAWNVAISAMAGCNGMGLKSVDEALTTPTKEGFRNTLQIVLQTLRLAGRQRMPANDELKLECEMVELEARAIIDTVLKLGEGDAAKGTVLAVDQGFIDTMFSPYQRLKGKVLLARDATGAFRYIEHGGVPLPKEVIEYHRSRMAVRAQHENREPGIDWSIEEVTWAGSPHENSNRKETL